MHFENEIIFVNHIRLPISVTNIICEYVDHTCYYKRTDFETIEKGKNDKKSVCIQIRNVK